jgi:hypothetical protein
MILYIVVIEMGRSKKSKDDLVTKKMVDVMCDNISTILLEMGFYPGTEMFDKTFYRLMDEIEIEIKERVIKRIRQVIDN